MKEIREQMKEMGRVTSGTERGSSQRKGKFCSSPKRAPNGKGSDTVFDVI